MQLRGRTWWLAALGAVGMMLTACPTGSSSLACSGPEDCLESELCHPDDQVCVQLCSFQLDCSSEDARCEVLSPTVPQKICKCPTKECVGGRDP